MSNNVLLDNHIETSKILGFWDETYKTSVIKSVEANYKDEVLIYWGIQDIVINGDKVLIKWYKRHSPLTKDELNERYGR